MSESQIPSENPNNREEVFRSQSQVKQPVNKLLLLGGLVVAAIFVLVVFVLISNHKIAPNNSPNLSMDHGISGASLQATQSWLKNQLSRNREQQPVTLPAIDAGFAASDTETKKALLARQNTPTTVYETNLHKQSSAPADETVGATGGSAIVGGGTGLSRSQLSHYSQALSATRTSAVSGDKITHPAYTVVQGEWLHATLETAVDSDLPGNIRAVVTRPVYSYTGNQRLIPAGSRLIGQYSSLASNGIASARIFIMWNRIITPSGISIMINSPGIDSLGRAGMGADAIQTYFWQVFGTSALLSILSAGASKSNPSFSIQPNSADAYRTALSQSFANTAQAILRSNLNVKPTIHIYQGNSVKVFVAHDLDLYRVLKGSQHDGL